MRTFYFIKKELIYKGDSLFLVTNRLECTNTRSVNALHITILEKDDLKNAKVRLVHPKERAKSLLLCTDYKSFQYYESWKFQPVTEDYYYGDQRSVIMCLRFEK